LGKFSPYLQAKESRCDKVASLGQTGSASVSHKGVEEDNGSLSNGVKKEITQKGKLHFFRVRIEKAGRLSRWTSPNRLANVGGPQFYETCRRRIEVSIGKWLVIDHAKFLRDIRTLRPMIRYGKLLIGTINFGRYAHTPVGQISEGTKGTLILTSRAVIRARVGEPRNKTSNSLAIWDSKSNVKRADRHDTRYSKKAAIIGATWKKEMLGRGQKKTLKFQWKGL